MDPAVADAIREIAKSIPSATSYSLSGLDRVQASIVAHHDEEFGRKSFLFDALKLAEEAGEVAGAAIRLHEGRTGARAQDIADECGDVFNTMMVLLDDHGFDAREVLATSVEKFLNRSWPDVPVRNER
jgi:NTP pyrophosphatase (non-canonical NTP hydrolase)